MQIPFNISEIRTGYSYSEESFAEFLDIMCKLIQHGSTLRNIEGNYNHTLTEGQRLEVVVLSAVSNELQEDVCELVGNTGTCTPPPPPPKHTHTHTHTNTVNLIPCFLSF